MCFSCVSCWICRKGLDVGDGGEDNLVVQDWSISQLQSGNRHLMGYAASSRQHVFEDPGRGTSVTGAVMSECDEQGARYGVQRGRVGRLPWCFGAAVLYVRSHGSYAAGSLRPGLLFDC